MAANSFEDFLKEKKQSEKPIDWTSRKLSWLSSVESLYNNINSWLAPFVNNSLISINSKDLSIYEQHIGDYKIAQLDIRIGNDIVSLVPRGTIVMGSSGRIDLRGPKRDLFILEDKWNEWKFTSKLNNDLKSWSVNEKSFQEAIQDVING